MDREDLVLEGGVDLARGSRGEIDEPFEREVHVHLYRAVDGGHKKVHEAIHDPVGDVEACFGVCLWRGQDPCTQNDGLASVGGGLIGRPGGHRT